MDGTTGGEAQRTLDDLRLRKDASQLGIAQGEREMVAVYLKRWLEGAKDNVRITTWQRYDDLVRLHVESIIGKKRLASL